MVHVGIGYDVHALVEGRKLVLGGVEIPHSKGLDGHSDADVLMHAVCDAILGALGKPDIGHYFPNTDPRWRGAPSRIFLEEAARAVQAAGGEIVNIDATLIAQQPKVYPHVAVMKANIGKALGIAQDRVGIKATTNELLGFIGREEGIAAMAVTSIDLAARRSDYLHLIMAKAEISWRRVSDDGVHLQVYAQHVSREWRFFIREKRFDQWQSVEDPILEDWLELLDSVKRRINRRLLRPEEEALVKKAIRERYPDAELE